ncbi:hypothetical protein MAE30S32_47220, partial [Microcystis aeruginosa 11-30S32]
SVASIRGAVVGRREVGKWGSGEMGKWGNGESK